MAYCRLIDPVTSPLSLAIRAARQKADDSRPSGLHLSTICDDYCKALYPAKYRGLSEAASVGYQEIGNTFEQLLSAIFAERFRRWTKPAPRRRAGIWGSPDGADRSGHTLDEVKAAWASAHQFVTVGEDGEILGRSPKFTRYEMQILGYLYIWRWRRARLHVWFVNGDWRPPRPEWPRTYLLKYTDEEIKANWRKLVQHAWDRKWLSRRRYLRAMERVA